VRLEGLGKLEKINPMTNLGFEPEIFRPVITAPESTSLPGVPYCCLATTKQMNLKWKDIQELHMRID
jgi:hypothetical protein